MATENKTPQWLINIQENSWNVELFISIGFTFILLRLPLLFDNMAFSNTAVFGVFANSEWIRFIIHLALAVLPIGFITHLIFRGIWIGLVGFSYVFPEGIQSDKLDYPDKYKEIITKSKDPIKIIVNFEKICSLIYTFTFLFFFLLVAVFNFLLVTGIILEIINSFENSGLVSTIFRYFFLLIGLIYAFDFFTAGFFKKNKYTSVPFYPIYRALSVITLAKLYRTQYYTLITRFNKRKVSSILFAVLILYILINYASRLKFDKRLYSNTFHQEYLIFADRYYENLIPNGQLIKTACIQSDIIKEDYLKLLICHEKYWEYYFGKKRLNEINIKIDSFDNAGIVKDTYKYVIARYNELYKVYLDEKRIENIDWLFYKHPKTAAGGIVSYLDISNLNKGHHQIRILLMDDSLLANIHFWKE